MEFEVRLTGETSLDLDFNLAARQFAKVFKTDLKKATKIVTSNRAITLRKNLSKERASKMVSVLGKIGLDAEVVPMPIQASELSLIPEPELEPITTSESPSESNANFTDHSEIQPNHQPAAKKALAKVESQNGTKDRSSQPPQNSEDDNDSHTVGEFPDINVVPFANGFAWISAGYQLMKNSPVQWIVASAVAILLNAGIGAIPDIGPFLMIATWPILFAGLMVGAHKQAQGQDFMATSFLNGLGTQPLQLILVGGIYFAFFALLVGLMTGVISLLGTESNTGIAFSIMTAAIFLPFMILFFAPTLVAINQLSAFQACKLSLYGGLKNVLPFVLFNVGLMLVLFLGALAFGIGMLVAMPITIASLYAAYRDIYE